jgi:hypothetical protein
MESNKRNKHSILNNFLWYSSGLDIRELAEHSRSRSTYFGLGGVNLFSTLTIIVLGILASSFAFSKMPLILDCIVGLIFGAMTFFFNRQTISMLNESEKQSGGKNWNSITTLPAFILAIFISLLISTPLKFYLFEVPIQESIFKSLKALGELTDSSVSLKISSWSVTILVALVILFPVFIKLYSRAQKVEKDRSTILNEIMWFCAGTNTEILRRCPTDHSKYFGIGGTILFTALMATMSGGYAFYTAFHNPTSAIFFGLFWGAMIFNLDRYIVNTIYTDGTVKITRGEIYAALPRIIIAIFLGIVISMPIELKLFENEITAQCKILVVNNEIKAKSRIDSLFVDTKVLDTKNTQLNNDINSLKLQTQAALDKYQSVKQIKQTKRDSEGNIYFVYVWPPQYKILKDSYELIRKQNEDQISLLMSQIKTNTTTIGSSNTDRTVLVGKLNPSRKYSPNISKDSTKVNESMEVFDLSTRMQAFSELQKIKEKRPIKIASNFIMLLLIIIEIAPVLFKLMTESGPYDDMLKTIKHEVYVREKQKISDMNDEINTNIKISSEKNRNKLEAEVKANEELLTAIAMAQAEIAKTAVQQWKENELVKVLADPSCYIQSNQPAQK